MLAASEFVDEPATQTGFEASLKVVDRMSAACMKNGLIARAMPHGDILGFAQPLITTRQDMEEIAGIVSKSVSEVTQQLSKEGVI